MTKTEWTELLSNGLNQAPKEPRWKSDWIVAAVFIAGVVYLVKMIFGL